MQFCVVAPINFYYPDMFIQTLYYVVCMFVDADDEIIFFGRSAKVDTQLKINEH